MRATFQLEPLIGSACLEPLVRCNPVAPTRGHTEALQPAATHCNTTIRIRRLARLLLQHVALQYVAALRSMQHNHNVQRHLHVASLHALQRASAGWQHQASRSLQEAPGR